MSGNNEVEVRIETKALIKALEFEIERLYSWIDSNRQSIVKKKTKYSELEMELKLLKKKIDEDILKVKVYQLQIDGIKDQIRELR